MLTRERLPKGTPVCFMTTEDSKSYAFVADTDTIGLWTYVSGAESAWLTPWSQIRYLCIATNAAVLEVHGMTAADGARLEAIIDELTEADAE